MRCPAGPRRTGAVGEIFACKDVAENVTASDWQDAEQFQRGLLPVGLGVNANLSEVRLSSWETEGY